MSIEETLQSDLKTAMKNKDAETLGTLRMLKAAIDNKKIENKSDDMSDDQILQIIQKQAKQRKESAKSFQDAGRAELAEKEKRELAILEKYLPEQLSPEELEKIVQACIAETGASSKADMGKVMKSAREKVGGSADGKTLSGLVAKLLN